jgi:hypothetical protein
MRRIVTRDFGEVHRSIGRHCWQFSSRAFSVSNFSLRLMAFRQLPRMVRTNFLQCYERYF